EIASEGSSAITTITLSGEGHENFTVDTKGVFRVAQGASFDMEAMPLYKLEAVAINESGISSLGAEVIIEVADLPNAPYATSLEITPLVENTPPGTLAGKIVFEDAESTVTSIDLTGEGSDDFTVNISGDIYVAEGAQIDYERQSSYKLEVSATNAQGNSSLPVVVNIAVKNVFDTPAIQLVFVERVSENAPIGHEIGTIEVLREGVGPVTGFTILGGDNIPFAIDANGTVSVASYLNYEVKDEYSFMAVAQSDYGQSNRIYVNIIVDDAPEIGMPVLSDFSGSIREDATAEAVVGKITLQSGSSPVEEINLMGMGSEYFSVANDGTISVSTTALFDYELFQSYDLTAFARNAHGTSAEVNVHINVIDVPDLPPRIEDTYIKVSEDTAPQVLIGKVLYVQGDSTIDSFTLEGIGSEKFVVDSNGTIRLNATLDYETTSRYQLNIVAHSSIGDSNIATIDIVVEDVPDSPPVVYEFSGEVDENVIEHTLVGRVTFDEGSAPLNIFSLTGTGSELFAIDLNGEITVAVGALLNYETTSLYHLYASAANSFGVSQRVPVTITIRDIPEVATLQPLVATVRDQAIAGTIVGYLPVQENGEPIIEMRLDGIGKEDFTIDVDGTVKVSKVANLDYTSQAEYFLSVQAVYAQDVSERVEVKIEVTPYMHTRLVDPFNDGSAIVIHPLDDVMSLQGIELTGTPLFSDISKFGRSVYFDSLRGCVGLGIGAQTGDFTMSVWVKPQQSIQLIAMSTSGTAYYSSSSQSEVFYPTHGGTSSLKRVGIGLSVGTNGVVVPMHSAGLMPSLLTYAGPLNEWDFITVTVQNGTPRLYINGVFMQAGLQTPNATLHPSNLSSCGYTRHRMTGYIDQISIFDRILTDEEILELYNIQ
ncbi:LamG-like jellyroll fold domain-containing protein, partial [Sulfurovum sp.]|uniref:LamG-like jellyroll fold domain-containing protein n=1 Tax=Sulfurovum sp. TaxID=1969726 RepID=UPI0035626508